MSSLTKGLILLLVVLGIGVGLVFWKKNVGHTGSNVNGITKEEIELLVADLAKDNPAYLKRLGENPDMRKEQIDSLRELFALASGARAEGLANDPTNKTELETIRAQVIAVNYDREIHKDAGPMPPFGFIEEPQINAFYGQGEQTEKGFFDNLKDKIGLGARDNELAFQRFLESKIALIKENNPSLADKEISEDERKQAREMFAKVGIYEQEFQQKAQAGELDPNFVKKVNLQVKLQQAQFLARLYSKKNAEKMKVTDEEVEKFIAENPAYSAAEKKTKAEEILARVKNGEDFATLANEFTEDPGNKAPDGKLKGGLYENNPKGRMVPAFEQAALSLEPGQVYDTLVETDYGYHIVKLERKGVTKDDSGKEEETYDVRHILISNGIKDPDDPESQEMPAKMLVRRKLEEKKQKDLIEGLIARNGVSVPDDFDVPEVTDEMIQEAMQKQRKQMGLDESEAPAADKAPPAKKEEAKPKGK
ncbi:peptidylprolyl isomerase [Leptolyngbya sp. 7M]|uniref:peptidylprolyl isomerase n=1 Tax=Leptolyngbya sp. 7M TaxID=2812896 RepID=UPI001B8C0C8A|nr:peptidylprolyl isomerase [Leptolyngbya sp. 7M]QYO65431.1 peptidylprolyl isomerase [Leptolyngbya sp. 7M]